MNTYILDTNFIYAIIDKSDFLHKSAVKVLQEIPFDAEIIVPFIVLAELSIVDVGVDIVNLILQNEVKVQYNTLDDLYLIDEVLSSKQKRSLRANDCLIISVVIQTRGILLTFDKKLLNVSQGIL